jgi:hypothetical protein
MVGFNRPDNFEKVLDGVRTAKPYKVYIAIDGARQDRLGEDKLVERTKQIASTIDWPCEIYYKCNDVNLGAEVTISSALRWICEMEEYFIMLEDDIVAPLSFFRFQEEMLIRYKDCENIKLVSGNNFTPLPTPHGEDYFFSEYGHTWGWGSWRRVWKDFDLNIEIPKEHCTVKFCRTLSNSKEQAKRLAKHYNWLRKQGVGNCTWDYISSYKCKVNRMLSIVPRVNLTTNIGIVGLHARGETKYHNLPSDRDFIAKKHPAVIECWINYDIYHFNTHYPKSKNFIIRVINYISRALIGNNIFD